jgi:hypothetical protein
MTAPSEQQGAKWGQTQSRAKKFWVKLASETRGQGVRERDDL